MLTGEIPQSWQPALAGELTKPYWQRLTSVLRGAKAKHIPVYPPTTEIYKALELTPFDTVKVVILGQDPYHGPGQAHGLSFSVPRGEKIPPSLRNIFKELHADLGIPMPKTGNLEPWAKRGVLLLNAVLSVEQGKAGAHAGAGWENLTDSIIARLSQEREHLVFVLWGAQAQKKAALIDATKHLILTSAHPSPLSAHRGFFGSRPFSRINDYLQAHGKAPIDWQLPEA